VDENPNKNTKRLFRRDIRRVMSKNMSPEDEGEDAEIGGKSISNSPPT
jgi:hypothetical protein